MPVIENSVSKKLVRICENLIPRTAVKVVKSIYVMLKWSKRTVIILLSTDGGSTC